MEVRDRFENPVDGVNVRFRPTEGSGSVSHTDVVTRVDGRADTHWILGETLGEQSVEALVAGTEGATFTAQATAGSPATGALPP